MCFLNNRTNIQHFFIIMQENFDECAKKIDERIKIFDERKKSTLDGRANASKFSHSFHRMSQLPRHISRFADTGQFHMHAFPDH